MKFLVNNYMIMRTDYWEERMGDISIENFAKNNNFNIVDIPIDVDDEKIKHSHFTLTNNSYEFDRNKYNNDIYNKVLDEIRIKRDNECFNIINRGKLWYDNLTLQQVEELNLWYDEWLNLPNREDLNTTNPQYPQKPSWIN